MSDKKYQTAVYIGRFQPFHNGHEQIINTGLRLAEKVLILCGSSNTPRTPKNPWTFEERKSMILSAFPVTANIEVQPLNDYSYDENRWICQVQNIVGEIGKTVLLGYQRDDSSYYLSHFPQWGSYFSAEHFHYNEPVNGTHLREIYFRSPGAFFKTHFVDMLPDSVVSFMKEWASTKDFQAMYEEWFMIKCYKESWEGAPYAPTFVTADSIVLQSGYVLLIQRKGAPGKDLWAIPGGFLDGSELLIDAAVRELREETGLKVPEKVLRGSITYNQVFDSPRRSQRGRTITHAYLFELNNTDDLPRVRGNDDAKRAEWFSLREVEAMSPIMFEDHWSILQHMVSRTSK